MKFTEKIPNDTISVRSDLDEEWSKKLQDAFIEIGKNEEGHKIIKEVYSHEGYVKSDDSKFDIVREYGKKSKNAIIHMEMATSWKGMFSVSLPF